MAVKLRGDVFDAAYRVAHDYGVPELAGQLGIPAGTLYNKLNTHESTHHKLTLADVIRITVTTRDLRILQALARTLGCVCFEVPKLDSVSDAALLELVAKVGAEQGEFFRAISEGLADKRFTRGEFQRIQTEAFHAISALVECTARIEGLIDG